MTAIYHQDSGKVESARPPALSHFSLSRQFALAGSIVMLFGMIFLGSWVSEKIKEGTIDNAAISTALLVDGLIAPLAQDLKTRDTLTIGPIRALDEILNTPALRERVVAIKIWKPDGLVAYSDNLELTGKKFPPSDSLKKALTGQVVGEFDQLTDIEDMRVRNMGVPILAIYSPVREQWSGKIIAVAEIYQNASRLKNTLAKVKRQSWLVVAATTIAMALTLFGVVHRASKLIERQRADLQMRMAETGRVSRQNANLRNQIAEASRRTAELNEQYLRRISADLHDGPAQLIGHAALRLHSLQPPGSSDEKKREVHSISENLSDAMNDIRNICKGLSLPATKDKPLAEIVEDVIRAHRKRTSSKVSTDIGKLPDDVPEHIKICTYRFIQEGLNNAWLHAGGKDQHVACHIAGDELAVAVTNSLSDDHQQKAPGRRGGLGLAGLKGRVETLGGQFSFEKNAENGVCLKMLINIAGDPADV